MALTELSGPLSWGLTVLVVLSAAICLVLQSLVILGCIANDDNRYNKTTYLALHIAAILVPIVMSPLSLFLLNGVPLTRTVTGCVVVESVQIFVVVELITVDSHANISWMAETLRPGFEERNTRRLYITLLLSIIVPIFILGTSTAIFTNTQPNNVIWNVTYNTEACDWSVYPRWYPYLFAYGIVIPGCLIFAVGSLFTLFVSMKQSNQIEGQRNAVAENDPGNEVNIEQKKALVKKRRQNCCILGFDLLFRHCPFLALTLLMLHCPTQCSHPTVLNCLWTAMFNVTAALQALEIITFYSKTRVAVKGFFAKLCNK